MSDESGFMAAQDRIYSFSKAASQNLASHDYFLVETDLAAFAIFQGQFQGTS